MVPVQVSNLAGSTSQIAKLPQQKDSPKARQGGGQAAESSLARGETEVRNYPARCDIFILILTREKRLEILFSSLYVVVTELRGENRIRYGG